jgi:hypothetical protein
VLSDRGALEDRTTTGGEPCGFSELCGGRALVHALHAQKGRRETWVNPQVAAARLLPRAVRPSRPGRVTVAGRAKAARRTATRAAPHGDDPEPDLGADGAAGGRA